MMSGSRRPEKSAATDAASSDEAAGLQPDPAVSASWLSFVFFMYVTPLVNKAKNVGITLDDVWRSEATRSHEHYTHFTQIWARRREQSPDNVGVFRVFVEMFWKRFLIAHSMYLLRVVHQVSLPIIIRQIILYLEDRDTGDISSRHAFIFGALILVVPLSEGLLFQHSSRRVLEIAAIVRACLSQAVYDKAMRLPASSAGRHATVGQIVNLVSTDSRRLLDGAVFTNMVCASPWLTAACLALLINLLGPAPTMLGFAVYIVLIPINGHFSRRMIAARRAQMKEMDRRLKVTNEVLQGALAIKLFGWEESFMKKLDDVRNGELSWLGRFIMASSVNSFCFGFAPIAAAAVTFSVYAALGNELRASVVFPSIGLFMLVRIPTQLVPLGVSMAAEVGVAFRRISAFLRLPEMDPRPVLPRDAEVGLRVSGATFTWTEADSETADGEPHKAPALQGTPKAAPTFTTPHPMASNVFRLRNIDLVVPRGQLVALVGRVGSGKTSLCDALLGEMELVAGSVEVFGSIAYVPQQAFIMNDTIKNNILFGRSMNVRRYQETIEKCALRTDLEMFDNGDMTIVGDRGITLSGGQKARVSLARAMYAQADVYILDDPTAAVDAWVGQHLFTKCINGALRGKTRVYITNHIEQAEHADIVVMMEHGRIVDQGTYEELCARSAPFQALLDAYRSEDRGDSKEEPTSDAVPGDVAGVVAEDVEVAVEGSREGRSRSRGRSTSSEPRRGSRTRSASAEPSLAKNVQRARQAEVQDTGGVSMAIVARYFLMGSSRCGVAMLVCLAFLPELLRVGAELWLALWTQGRFDLSTAGYIGVYSGLSSMASVTLLLVIVVIVRMVLRAGVHMHQALLKGVLRSPMKFFDTTPTGQVLNRFSKDLGTTDQSMHDLIASTFRTVITVSLEIIVIATAMPVMLVVFGLVGFGYYYVQGRYRPVSRDVKRVESLAHSPLYAHLGESLNGVETIRAYSHTTRFSSMNMSVLDASTNAWYMGRLCDQWLAVRLSLLGGLSMSALAVFSMLFRDLADPSLAALAINYCLFLTQYLQYGVQMIVKFEAQLTSVQRILAYTDLPPEKYERTDVAPKLMEWPARGEVQFDSLCMRYREGLPLVINNLTFTVKPGEKVAVVGRTGAGKSSLVKSLFRIVEPAQGRTLVDGVDISTIGLDDLRQSRVAIIPQDPTLFSGTVRYNLDPFGLYSDASIISALKTAHLGPQLQRLDSEVAGGGENLSVGERQLLCLARALLRKPRLLVLDEATASVDATTDTLVQDTIRTEFPDASVIAICHRLSTCCDYDKIVVMAAGHVGEMGSPGDLLRAAAAAQASPDGLQPDTQDGGAGLFAGMVDAGGPAVSARLRRLVDAAEAAQASRGVAAE